MYQSSETEIIQRKFVYKAKGDDDYEKVVQNTCREISYQSQSMSRNRRNKYVINVFCIFRILLFII